MKKITFFAAVFISILFSSCFNAVYYEIRKDVPPTESTVTGNIPEITRTTVGGIEFLVVNANEGIRYKQKDINSQEWQVFETLPFDQLKYDFMTQTYSGEQILKILSTKDTLYLVSAKYSYNESLGTSVVSCISIYGIQPALSADSYKIWDNSAEWTPVIIDSENKIFEFYYSNDYQYNKFAIFQTNSPIADNRQVFIRSGNSSETAKYYTLNGLEYPVECTSQVYMVDSSTEDGSTDIANSAVYFNGKTLFFNSIASTTNETYDTPATRFYFGKKEKLWANTDSLSLETKEILDAENSISTLATTADSILIGRGNFASNTTYTGGIAKTTLDASGEPGSELVDFDTNASFQISTSYLVNSIVNATPEKTETESSLYCSTSIKGTGTSTGASYNKRGLWSYYPERGNWNQE